MAAGGRRPSVEHVRQRRLAAVRRRVQEKALVEVRGCLRDWDDGRDAAREAKAVIETIIAPEYEGRVLIELVQNAHDAHPAGAADGRIEIRLDEDEGEYGTLYVANRGKPFNSKNFKDLCSIALSRKRADAGIGHKGVGFKSVLNLCGAPEIYSVTTEGSRVPDGLTFRFARLDDYDALAREVASERADFADYLKENLHTLKVPVFLEEAPKTIHSFTRRGFVTVVRLPLKSADARSAAAAQVRELMDDSAPFELFLDRLERVKLEWRAAGETQRRTYDRQVEVLHQARGLKVQQVTVRRRMRLIVICGKAEPDRAREALTASIERSGMRHDWMAWEKKAEVRVAVPVADPLPKGRLYTFLPMGEQIAAPLRGFVHAPFFAELNRRSFNAAVPWNALLLDTVAETCARAVLATTDGRAPIPSGALVDLMCWQPPTALLRLTSAFQRLGHGLAQVPFLPAIATASGTRTSLHQAVLWEGKEHATAFTPHAVAATGAADLLDPQLHPVRLRGLVSLARSVGTRLQPSSEHLASWAERLAEATVRAPFDPGWWADFYYDLSREFANGSDVAGKRIILTSGPALAPAAAEGVFFDREFPRGGSLPALPAGLSGRLHFVHAAIAWTGKGGKRRAQGRTWLKTAGLVHDYGADQVLEVVAAALRADGTGKDDDGVRLACLRYACALSHTLEKEGRKPPRLQGLRVPTRGGWQKASRAMFGPGWPGEHSAVDDTLARFLEHVRDLSPTLTQTERRLLPRPEELCGGTISVEVMRRFLERHYVAHGLRPRNEVFHTKVRGEDLNRPARFWTPGKQDLLPQWRTAAEHWPNRRRVGFISVEYHSRSHNAAVLPGQEKYAAFSEEDRRLFAELVVHGLAFAWPDSALEMNFVRHTDSAGTPWPTPLAAFLTHAPWIPQTTVPGAPAEGTVFATASRAWWWQGTQSPPSFLSVVPATLRSRRSTHLVTRLGLLGIRSWDDAGTALDRLGHLPDLVRTGPHLREGGHAHEIRREYEKAWAQLLPAEGGTRTADAAPTTPPPRLLVHRAGDLEPLDSAQTDETVFVPDPDGAQNRALLDRVPVPVIPIRDRALGARVHAFLDQRKAFDVQRCGDAAHDIQADGLPVREAVRLPLAKYAGPWLLTLVAALLEFDEERAFRTEPVTVAEATGLLRGCEVTVADEAVVWIAGHRLTENGADRALLHPHPERPCVVVVHSGPRTGWRVLRTAAPALAALIRAPHLEAALWKALTRLEERGLKTDNVSEEELADVLELRQHQLRAVLAERASQRSGSPRLVPLLACLDLDLAEELQQRIEDFPDRAALLVWLTSRAGAPDAGRLMRLLDDDDSERQLRALSVPLGEANRAWQTLGLPQIDNTARHDGQFASWLQRNRPALTERIRDAHADVHRSGRSLAAYVRLRGLPSLAPDPAWHTTLWDLTDQLLQDHADAWLTRSLPTQPSTSRTLAPLAEVREASTTAVHQHLPRLRQVIEDWQRLHPTSRTLAPPPPQEVLRALDTKGLLDFEVLSKKALITWLSDHGHWPAGMPLSDRPAQVGLSSTAPAPAGNSGAAASTSRPGTLLPRPTVVLNGRLVPAGPDDLAALARQVAADLTPEQRATPATAVTALAPRIPRPRTPPQPATGSQGGSYQAAGNDQDRTLPVGLAGEAAVAVWLHKQFGVEPQNSWKSSLRVHGLAGAQPGDDRLGYDFLIHDGNATYLYEVKSSTGDSGEIILGGSEVRRASHLAPAETYFIVYVSNVLNRARRNITVLPNPFSAPDLAGYELVSTQMRLRFNLG
ncbi:sacsin N-terminal ATP-binding-like domain-containing protein [Streptomyces sp. NPDC088246]|uniref:sacsin N-terminal ATP-binding-like domain-containing protein n=1 Tax=Streptomyces sp. NPDC088246 TaxID=3365842 RepID=UPI00381F10A1